MVTSRFQLGLIAALAAGLGFSLSSSEAVGYPAGAAVSQDAAPDCPREAKRLALMPEIDKDQKLTGLLSQTADVLARYLRTRILNGRETGAEVSLKEAAGDAWGRMVEFLARVLP